MLALAASIIAVAGLLLFIAMTSQHGGDSAAVPRLLGFAALALGPLFLFTAARRLISNTKVQTRAYRHGLPAD